MLTYLLLKQEHTPLLQERVVEVFFGEPHWSEIIVVCPELSINEAYSVVIDRKIVNYDAATDSDVSYELVPQSLDA